MRSYVCLRCGETFDIRATGDLIGVCCACWVKDGNNPEGCEHAHHPMCDRDLCHPDCEIRAARELADEVWPQR